MSKLIPPEKKYSHSGSKGLCRMSEMVKGILGHCLFAFDQYLKERSIQEGKRYLAGTTSGMVRFGECATTEGLLMVNESAVGLKSRGDEHTGLKIRSCSWSHRMSKHADFGTLATLLGIIP